MCGSILALVHDTRGKLKPNWLNLGRTFHDQGNLLINLPNGHKWKLGKKLANALFGPKKQHYASFPKLIREISFF